MKLCSDNMEISFIPFNALFSKRIIENISLVWIKLLEPENIFIII